MYIRMWGCCFAHAYIIEGNATIVIEGVHVEFYTMKPPTLTHFVSDVATKILKVK
jgi:hypothetical protein